MTPTATHIPYEYTSEVTLFVAFELSEKNGELGFTTVRPKGGYVLARQLAFF